jgi:hypothetical protein
MLAAVALLPLPWIGDPPSEEKTGSLQSSNPEQRYALGLAERDIAARSFDMTWVSFVANAFSKLFAEIVAGGLTAWYIPPEAIAWNSRSSKGGNVGDPEEFIL